ncbi:MAG: branched-chain amino acid ABC transporter permease, partial [Deltaproteobacteria bacterium]|nr:branched-chain amino acid ABC transporter permease [Deltaproteobacteria bacterium]
MEFWVTQSFNGISYGALLFLLGGGLSLIFGMMRIVNMTHGSYYLLGGYMGLTVIWRTGSFLLAILAGALTIAIVGVGEWNAFLKRLSGQELGQVLTTMGFALIFQDLGLVIWGGDPYTIPTPAGLSGAYQVGELFFPVYRIFIIAVALGVAGVLWLILEQTRIGAMTRATVDDAEMARGVGINVP